MFSPTLVTKAEIEGTLDILDHRLMIYANRFTNVYTCTFIAKSEENKTQMSPQ